MLFMYNANEPYLSKCNTNIIPPKIMTDHIYDLYDGSQILLSNTDFDVIVI